MGGRSQTQDAPAMAAEEVRARAMGEGKPKVSLDICATILFLRARKSCPSVVQLLPCPPQSHPFPSYKILECCCWKGPQRALRLADKATDVLPWDVAAPWLVWCTSPGTQPVGALPSALVCCYAMLTVSAPPSPPTPKPGMVFL